MGVNGMKLIWIYVDKFESIHMFVFFGGKNSKLYEWIGRDFNACGIDLNTFERIYMDLNGFVWFEWFERMSIEL